MTQEQAVQLLTALRCANIYARGNGWVRASCPLAPWTHRNHRDATPSFGLLAKPSGTSTYNCYACGTGTVAQLVQTVQYYAKDRAGYNFRAAHEILNNEESDMPVLGEFVVGAEPAQAFEEWPQYWLDTFKPVEFVAVAWNYLKGRGVTEATTQAHNLRYDSKREMIVCPYWNVNMRFAGARGRSIRSDTTGIQRHYDYSFHGMNNAKLVWYNEPALNLPGPVVVVEGQFDCWRVERVWPKVLANLTARPSKEKLIKLADASTVILIPDNDPTGILSEQVYREAAPGLHLQLRVIKLPASVKDPDDCHPDYLRDAIEECAAS